MKRRTLIASVGIATTGGCLDRVTGSRTPPDDDERSVRIEGVDEVDELPVDIRVESITDRSTESHPAQFEVRFRNRSGATMTAYFGPEPPFSALESAGDGQLLFLSTDHKYSARAPGRWEPDLDEDALVVQRDVQKRVRLSPGSVVDGEYELWNAPNTSAYLPPGTYRFEETYSVSAEDTEREFDWGFTVRVA